MDNLPQRQSRQGYLVATTLAEARAVAEIIAGTNFLPRSYRDKANNPKINEIIIAGNMGARHGWDMFQSIQAICVINNRPSIWGEYFWGLILSDPRFIKCKETWDKDVEGGQWVVEIWKINSEFPVVGTFSFQDASTAGLLSDTNKKHTWGKYPKDMCLWRARGRAGKSGFSDAIQGFAMVEEQRDIVDVTYQAIEEKNQIKQTQTDKLKAELAETQPTKPRTGSEEKIVPDRNDKATTEAHAGKPEKKKTADSKPPKGKKADTPKTTPTQEQGKESPKIIRDRVIALVGSGKVPHDELLKRVLALFPGSNPEGFINLEYLPNPVLIKDCHVKEMDECFRDAGLYK